MELIYGKELNKAVVKGASAFCPGCMHSTANKILGEVLTENNWIEDTIMVMPIGCACNSIRYMDVDMVRGLHGRAGAVATGVKRIRKDKIVIAYQGDGDAAAIGGLETFYAANRGEPFTVIMINNQIYGMTGGQMSPCTLVGQDTETGERIDMHAGYPVKCAEMIAQLPAVGFSGRFSLHTPGHILQAKKAIKDAIELQINDGKYSFVEILSACPVNWRIKPEDGPKTIESRVLPVFPLGIFKDCRKEVK
ncbi:MAG TPA: thiamine pyrophosphate-dependent enzyme [Terriglobales bacterium]|nr:thiamine pyrophosphate-dependent enzyme [Terriglobales bacterium]